MPDCVFCAIAAGAPAHFVLETDSLMAFLDVRPLFPGHVLVAPREHVPTLAELPEAMAGPLLLTVQRLANAVEEAMSAAGTFVAVNNKVSQSVPHLHVHVVPRNFKDGLRGFFWPRQRYESEEAMARTAAAITASLG